VDVHPPSSSPSVASSLAEDSDDDDPFHDDDDDDDDIVVPVPREVVLHEGTVWGWLPAEESGYYFPEEPKEAGGNPRPRWRVKFGIDITDADIQVRMKDCIDLDERELAQVSRSLLLLNRSLLTRFSHDIVHADLEERELAQACQCQ
jgi:hypothetical protein